MIYERLSLNDDSMIASYEEHIQRDVFALEYCRGRRVLGAGCGTGYGSHSLAANGAKSVLAFDISDDGLSETGRTIGCPIFAASVWMWRHSVTI